MNEAGILSGEHKFIFVVPDNSKVVPVLKKENVPFYTLPLREISRSLKTIIYPFFLAQNFLKLRKIIKQERIDIVQINDFYNLLGACLKATGYKGKLITYVRFLPSVMPALLRNFWINTAQRYSYKLVAVSDAVLKQLPPHKNNIRIYDPALLSEKYNNGLPDAKQDILLLYLANFTNGKGQDHALEAFNIAYKQNPKLRLKFVGGNMGLKKNEEYRQRLIHRVNELGLQPVVFFEHFTTDIEKEIKSAAIVLNFSEAESFSMTCLEAGYYGLPVIATKCGGPEEIILHDRTGLLVEKRNIDMMAEAILALADNEIRRVQLGTAARQYVREKFSTDNFKQALSQILS